MLPALSSIAEEDDEDADEEGGTTERAIGAAAGRGVDDDAVAPAATAGFATPPMRALAVFAACAAHEDVGATTGAVPANAASLLSVPTVSPFFASAPPFNNTASGDFADVEAATAAALPAPATTPAGATLLAGLAPAPMPIPSEDVKLLASPAPAILLPATAVACGREDVDGMYERV